MVSATSTKLNPNTPLTQKPVETQGGRTLGDFSEYDERLFEQGLTLEGNQTVIPEEVDQAHTLASYTLVVNEDGSRSYAVVETQSRIETPSATTSEDSTANNAFRQFITEVTPKIDLGGATVKAMEGGAKITSEAAKEAFGLAKYILRGPSPEKKPQEKTPEEERKRLEGQARVRRFKEELQNTRPLEVKVVEVADKQVRIEDLTKTIGLQESYTGVVDNQGRVNISHKAAFEQKETENQARAIQAERAQKMAEVKNATLSSERFNLDEAAEGGGGLSGMTRGPGQ